MGISAIKEIISVDTKNLLEENVKVGISEVGVVNLAFKGTEVTNQEEEIVYKRIPGMNNHPLNIKNLDNPARTSKV